MCVGVFGWLAIHEAQDGKTCLDSAEADLQNAVLMCALVLLALLLINLLQTVGLLVTFSGYVQGQNYGQRFELCFFPERRKLSSTRR